MAQIAGAVLARWIAGMNILGKLADDYQSGSIGAEFLGFGILMLTVVATTENKVSKSGSGIAVGGALLAGLLMSKGILNPAVAIAMGEGLSPAGWITPISGIVPCLLFSLFERARPPKTES